MDDKQKQQEGELFHLLVENVRDYAIFIIDPQGRILSWSKGGERLLGYTEDEVIGQHFRLFFTPDDIARGEPEREVAQATTTGRGEDDRWHVRKDGSRLWVSGVLTRLNKDGEELRGFAKIMRDLTAQRQMEEELRKRTEELETANAHKDRFMAVLSHELRNPLAPIRNVVTIISQQTAESPVLQHASMILDRQVRQMTHLVEDLLDAARIATGKVKLNKELVEACVIVQRAVDTARPRSKNSPPAGRNCSSPCREAVRSCRPSAERGQQPGILAGWAVAGDGVARWDSPRLGRGRPTGCEAVTAASTCCSAAPASTTERTGASTI